MATIEFTTEELEQEEWKRVPGFNDRYEISNLGRFRSLTYHGKPRVKLLHPSPNTKGYVIATPYEDLRPHSISVHILVASAFVKRERPEQKQVNHKDLNKANNRASNLEWNTAKEDGEHRARTGAAASGDRHVSRTMPDRVPRGERHGTKTKPHQVARGSRSGSSTLTEEIIPLIRNAHNELNNYAAVARMFDISESNATRIVKRQSWKHVG